MSSIPNSAMPHAKAANAEPHVDRSPQREEPSHGLSARLSAVPTAAWLAGAAAVGVAGLATLASGLRGDGAHKSRATGAKKKRKAATAS